MRKILFLSLIILLGVLESCSKAPKQSDAESYSILKFGELGKFKIAQFTDIHWDENAKSNDSTIAIIKHVLKEEQPNLVILSGDIVCYEPAKEGWESIARIFEESKIPWLVLMGNHDAEQSMTREEIYQLLQSKAYYTIGKVDIEKCKIGDFILNIKSSDENKDAAVIYCMDSGDYPEATLRHGKYDWIHFDQIEWYRKYSKLFTDGNGGAPLPSLAYFHIPLPEYEKLNSTSTYYGANGEGGVSSSDINSGFLASAIEMNDVMGTFVGHDHNNSFIGQVNGIALAFGRVSGLNAYGDLERGARIVSLSEGQYQFDTWIRTYSGQYETYYYPSGITEDDENTQEYKESIELKDYSQGVRYQYFEYEGKIKSVEKLTDKNISTLKKEGTLENFSLTPMEREDHFGLYLNTWIKIPKDGIYKFYTYTDDGSTLYIDDQLVVDNDGSHSARRADGMIGLKAGFHALKLKYFESYMGEHVEVGISSRDISETIIPNEMLYITE